MSDGVVPIREVGVIGAGVMGAAIAGEHVRHGFPVAICDASEAALRSVHSTISQEGRRLVRLTSDPAALAQCDLVIESIGETAAAKQHLYAQLLPHLKPSAIVASNTSTIPIAELAAALPNPERFCGMHFFHPVAKRPLVEVVCGPTTSKATVARVVGHVQALQRRAIVAQDGPGFIVNRLLFPHLAEALTMLSEGVAPEAIERAAVDFGMAMGPLRLMDEIGLDTTLQAGWVLAMAFPDRIVASPLLVTMVKAKQLGCKSGAGFFVYDETSSARLSQQTDRIANSVPLLRRSSAGADPLAGTACKQAVAHGSAQHGSESAAPGINPALAKRIAQWAVAGNANRQTPQAIADRLLLPMVCEAARILEEGRASGPEEIDAGTVLGLGFPASRGGLLSWADTLGAAEVINRIQSLGAACRNEPPKLLVDLAKRQGLFYGE